MYHFVFPAKYRRVVFDTHVDEVLKEVCIEIEKRYQIKFIEIGTDRDHVHFLVQSVPTYPVTKLVTIIKSLTAREIFKQCPQVKKKLWGGEFWTDGYFASTVGKHGGENMIGKYVKKPRPRVQQVIRRSSAGALLIPRPLGRGCLLFFISDVEPRSESGARKGIP
jgi:REP element-mobilizing transposase RayT